MADNNKLELVVEVDVNKANASIKSVNTGLSSMEQAASKAAHGAAQGIDGMTASMVKGAAAGNLIAESIKKALEWAKEWTIEAANHAAHTDKMGMSMMALAKAHGVAGEAAAKSVEAVKRVGYSTEDAIHAVDRLMIADMSLSKAEGLAKVAKDAAAIENISPGEALEKLLMSIESGASRGLRTMGIFVDLNKEVERQEKLTGKTLGENEILQLRYNAVMREAAKIQGAAAAASGSAEAQSKALAREVNELREAIGEKFQGYLRSWVGNLRELVGFLRDNSDWLVRFAQGAMLAAGTLATYALAGKILEIGSAVKGLTAALELNPWALLITGVVASGAIVYKTWTDTKANVEKGYKDLLRKDIQKDLFSGKLKPADVKKMGYSDEQIREIIAGRKLVQGETWGDFSGVGQKKIKVLSRKELSDDEVDRIAAERKKRGEAERSAQELYARALDERRSAEQEQARARIEDSMRIIQTTQSETQAARESLSVALLSIEARAAGIERIREEEKAEIAQRSTYVDEKSGALRHFTLNASTLETIHKATAAKLAAFDLKFNEEESRRVESMWKALAERSHQMVETLYIEPMKRRLYVAEQQSQWNDKIEDQGRSAALAAIDQRQSLQLAQLDTVTARTLQDKVALENAKTEIEVQAMKERTKIELAEIDVRTERQVDEARKAAMAQGIFYEPFLDQLSNKVHELGQHEKDTLQRASTAEIDVAQLRGATSTRKLVVDQYQSIFQSLKQQAGGVFDALVTKSQSVWSAIGNSLKTALLTAIKDVVTSRVAALLMNMFVPGANVQMQRGPTSGGNAGGLLSGLSSVLGIGAVPVFAGGAVVPGGTPPFLPSSGYGSTGGGLGAVLPMIFGSSANILSPGTTPGTTPPFVSPSSGAGTFPTLGAGISKASFARMLPGLKSFLGFGENNWVNMGDGRMATGGWISQYGSFGDKLQALGKSDAALLGGAMLAMDGLRRGGKLGLAETTAGGAMIGFKFGGPVGAAIGAAAGAVAGIVRLFMKGATDKVREKIKALYGLDVSDKGVLTQIVDMAKQSFGGNLDLAIRSTQVRELLELYAMQTGQQWRGRNASTLPVSMVQSAGGVSFLPPTGQGGFTSVPWSSAAGIGGAVVSSANTTPAPVQVTISLDGPTTERVLQGQAITAIGQQPRAVATAMSEAYDQNYSRRETYAGFSDPGLVTSA